MILVFGCDKGLQGTRCDECVEGYYKHFLTCIEGSCNQNGTLHQDVFGTCLCDAGYSGPQCLKNWQRPILITDVFVSTKR